MAVETSKIGIWEIHEDDDMAIWDLVAKIADVPLYRLLAEVLKTVATREPA